MQKNLSDAIDCALLQDSFSWRATTLSRELACQIINTQGKIDKKAVEEAIRSIELNRFSLKRGHHDDADFMNHIYSILKAIAQGGPLVTSLMKVSAPYAHQEANRIIRITLHLPEKAIIGDREARQASLAALFCYLRQNVGSCFATAPAIRIQQEYPTQMLNDIASLFGTKRLQRIIDGIEYTVPFNVSFGLGQLGKAVVIDHEKVKVLAASPSLQIPLKLTQDQLEDLLKQTKLFPNENEPFVVITAEQILEEVLRLRFKKKDAYENALKKAKESFLAMTENPLLKSWEFTLASLSESKADFTRWNLFASLGLHPQEKNGIGDIIYRQIQEKIDRLQREIEEMEIRYQHLFAHAKQIEVRASHSQSEKEARWLLADYNVRKLEMEHALILRDEAYAKARKLSGLLNYLIAFYQEQCKIFFQEVYDPEMQDLTASMYDDSPAGFRLLYKHGRENPSLWTSIYTLDEYAQALSSFFTATEVELRHREEVKGIEKEIVEIVTDCVLRVREKDFLESSFHRLAKAYQEPLIKNPLDHIPKIKRKPWAYISGGTMMTLLHCYYGFSGKLEEKSSWVESETELFAFYLDCCKELPHSLQKHFLSHSESALLAFSPTHAFAVKPGYSLFAKGWESDLYSYSWIRDEIVNPSSKWIDSIELDDEMMRYLTMQVCETLPHGYRTYVMNKFNSFHRMMAPQDYREELVGKLSYEKWLKGGLIREIGDQVDAILYESLPFTFGEQIERRVGSLCKDLLDQTVQEKVMALAQKEQANRSRYELIPAYELLQLTKDLIARAWEKTTISFDCHAALQKGMHRLGYALREPVLFADTNWVRYRFGFCVNPGTMKLELWIFDRTASRGRPMSIWKEHVDGRSQGKWGLLTNPHQYGEI